MQGGSLLATSDGVPLLFASFRRCYARRPSFVTPKTGTEEEAGEGFGGVFFMQ